MERQPAYPAPMSVRSSTLQYGPPIYVPAASEGKWIVAGIDTKGAQPSGVVVRCTRDGGSSLDVRTSNADLDEPLFVGVVNLLCHSVAPGDVTLPLTLTVTERQIDLLVGGDAWPARLLETGTAWRLMAEIDGRVVSAAGRRQGPDELRLVRLMDLSSISDDHFPEPHRHDGEP